MYSTCLFCHASLGANTRVESFAVGRRLAYHAAKGRLWVVCRECERWNLTPLEERWEAIEACERLARASRRRVSTGEIELVTIDDAFDLVRIGAPSREEFAAWRYGDQFGRRRRRWLWRGAQTAVGAGALALGGVAAGAGALLVYAVLESAFWGSVITRRNEIVAHVPGLPPAAGGLRRREVDQARVWGDGDALHLHLRWGDDAHTFVGEPAARVASAMLAHVNRAGATRAQIAHAVRAIDDARDAERFVRSFAVPSRPTVALVPPPSDGSIVPPYRADDLDPRFAALGALDHVQRLALEMALHESSERRAMEGDLRQLEIAWRDAEEIAAIADALPSR